ncbi:MAG: O-antigen ligase family protein [Cyanobacteria bacterium]|nr:O-antigen ligase family protein [Cyanobacteriota bacterium]
MSKVLNLLNQIIKWLYIGLFFLTPLLMASFTSELFEFNKMMFIYLITLLIIFFWSLKMILTKKIIIKRTPFDIPIILFLSSQILSTIFSIDVQTSVFGYYGRFNGGLLSTGAYIVLFYGFISNLINDNISFSLTTFLKVTLLSSFLVILWGLPGRLGYDTSCLLFVGQFNNSCWTDQFRPAERMFSTLGQPNWLGAFLVINFFIGLYFLLKSGQNKDKINKFFYLAYLAINFISLLFTRSRSALGAVIVCLLIFVFYFIFSNRKIIKKPKIWNQEFSMLLLILTLTISIVIFKTGVQKIDQFLSPNFYVSIISKNNNSNNHQTETLPKANSNVVYETDVTASSDIREIVWKGAIDLGLRYPLFGTGVETFAYSYYFVRPKAHNLTSEWDFLYNKAHNEFLNYLATTGFLGLGSYMILILSIFIYFFSNLKGQNPNLKSSSQNTKFKQDSNSIGQSNNILLTFCLMISFLSILITNFFGFSTTTINLFFFLIPAFVIYVNKRDAKNTENKIKLTSSDSLSKLAFTQYVSFVFLSVIFIYLLSYLSRYYLADIRYAKGDNYAKLAEYQKSAQELELARNLRYEHVYDDKLSYVLANLAFIASYQKETDLAKNLINSSDALNARSINASPKNVLYWKTRAKDYYLFYQITLDQKTLDTGTNALLTAQKLAPTDPKIPYSLSIFYSLLYDETKDVNRKQELESLSLQAINSTVDLKSNYRDAYFLKGQLLKKFGKKDEARAAFEKILQNIDPNDTEVKKEINSL